MRLAGKLHLSATPQALQPILPDRLEHHETRLLALLCRLLQQAFVKEGGHAVEDPFCTSSILKRVAQRLHRLEGTATYEDGEPPEQLLLLGSGRVVAPGDGVARGLLRGGGILGPARQDSEGRTQRGKQRLGGQEFAGGRGQFNG